MIRISDTLVPLDLSEYAQHSLTYARELASSFGARLHLLHWPSSSDRTSTQSPTSPAGWTRKARTGLVLFNRFYQPDIDLEKLEVYPHVMLSTPYDLRLPLRWIGILCGGVRCQLAHPGGIHTHEDVIKALMAGAQVTMMASPTTSGPSKPTCERTGDALTEAKPE